MIVLPKDSSKDLNAGVHAYICIFYILHFDSYTHSCYSTSKAKNTDRVIRSESKTCTGMLSVALG